MNQLQTFMGRSLHFAEAIEEATAGVNHWLKTHQWKTYDGMPCYILSQSLTHVNDWWVCVISLLGPTEETPH